METKKIIFRQLFDLTTSTYTYLLADPVSLEAIIIDTVKEQANRDLNLIKELGLKLKYILETHIHADHVTGAALVRAATGAKTLVNLNAKVECTDGTFKDGDELVFGKQKIKVISTPGHTDSCTSFYIDGMLFTGDVLLIRGCGRTDFQQGSSERLYQSVKEKLFIFPDNTLVYPGHDYKGFLVSTIGEEKLFNPRLGNSISKEKFFDIMANLNLAYPKQIDVALPANMKCGNV